MAIEQVKEWIHKAKAITALTGAGISAESGVPTFRGPGGLWENHRPEDLATPQAFSRNPKLVWRWYDWRRGLIAPLKPNPGHVALAEMERQKPAFNLLTQNVDGLHAQAGSRNLEELHGNLWQMRCYSSCLESPAAWEDRRTPLAKIPPQCPYCGGMARPHVVWFGEDLNQAVLSRALTALACEVFLVIGTSGVVHPAASFASRARTLGAKVVEINLEATPLSSIADISLWGKSGEILPLLL